MDSERWQRIQDLFHAANELPEEEQRSFLESECESDGALLEQVVRMLANDRQSSFLDHEIRPPAEELSGAPDELPFDNELPFDFVGPYRLLKKLGEGGMGLVYLAERPDWGTSVAIKFPRDTWVAKDRLQRFAAEQRLLAHLTHPFIARIYEGGTLRSGMPWFAMEYVDGEPITEYCERRRCMTRERLRLFRVACEAVQYAHTQTIVHRDLKPSNILVNANGEIKLLDFGIAKQLEESRETSQRTRTGQQPLTLAYAAPEQVLANRVGTNTDVYSLGVVLYELLTGRVPFNVAGLTPSQAEAVIGTQVAERPSIAARKQKNANDSEHPATGASKQEWAELDVLVLKAMHKDAGQRYGSVDALMRDVDHYLKSEPLDARGDGAGYLLRKFLIRRRVPVMAAAAILAVIVSLISFFTYRLAKARDAALAEAARTRRVEAFMTDLLEGGDTENGPSKDLRVVSVLDCGVQKIHELDGDAKIQGDLYSTLGTIFGALGEYGKADSLQEAGLRKRIAGFGATSAEAAQSNVELAMLRGDESRYSEAEAFARKAVAIEEQRRPQDPILVAKYRTALGNVLMRQGKNQEAIEVLNGTSTVPGFQQKDPLGYGASLTLLVGAHMNLGEYAESEPLSRQMVAMDEKRHGPNHPDLAVDLVNQGSIEQNLGDYAEAERTYRRAIAIDTAWYPPGHTETADISRMLAQVLLEENKLDEATRLARQALLDQEKAHGPMHVRVALALGVVGKLSLKRGALNEAEADFKRALEICRANSPQYTGWALSALGDTYKQAKKYEQAAEDYQEAARDYAKYLPPTHANIALAQMHLGEVLLLQDRYQEAEGPLLSSYRVWLKQHNLATSHLKDSGQDLVRDYEALRKPEKAEQLRSEMAHLLASS